MLLAAFAPFSLFTLLHKTRRRLLQSDRPPSVCTLHNYCPLTTPDTPCCTFHPRRRGVLYTRKLQRTRVHSHFKLARIQECKNIRVYKSLESRCCRNSNSACSIFNTQSHVAVACNDVSNNLKNYCFQKILKLSKLLSLFLAKQGIFNNLCILPAWKMFMYREYNEVKAL